MRSAIASLLLCSVLVSSGEAQQDELDRLLASFSEMSGLSARFREEKRIALLAVPVRSEGEIHFAPPGRLLRRVTSPTRSAALIADGRITMVEGQRRQQIDLSQNPVVAGFVESFRHVLAGDRASLESAYALSYESSDDGWVLRLRPRTEALRSFLREMRFEGSGTEVERMRMEEVSGDVTLTTFHDVDADKEWSAAELQSTFRL